MSHQIQVAAVGQQVPHPGYEPVARHALLEDFSIYRPATFTLRAYALTLDFFLSTPLELLVRLPFHRYLERLAAYGHEGRHFAFTALLILIPQLAYFFAPTMVFGQTLGKKIVGLRVLRKNYDPGLDPWAILFRETLGKLALGPGFLLALFTDRKRGLHDYLSGTIVVSYRER